MDPKIKKRITMFYIGGVINALLGLYVLIEGASFLPPGSIRSLVIIFFLFAAADFYFPYAIKKKWQEENAGKQEQNTDPAQRT